MTRIVVDLQVNALGEWIIGIYLHELTNNEREISIPHKAAECGIENFEFIVSERVQLNPDNSRAMSVLKCHCDQKSILLFLCISKLCNWTTKWPKFQAFI